MDKPASNYDTDDDSIKFEYENIVTRYDQVDKDTYCLFCNKSLDSVDEFNRHVVDNHIWRRLVYFNYCFYLNVSFWRKELSVTDVQILIKENLRF